MADGSEYVLYIDTWNRRNTLHTAISYGLNYMCQGKSVGEAVGKEITSHMCFHQVQHHDLSYTGHLELLRRPPKYQVQNFAISMQFEIAGYSDP